MATLVEAAEVQRRLLDWYASQARDLPWRRTRDPYAVLVAEVMLQQTQVDRVVDKWYAWLDRFPSLQALASANRADAIRAWQGLGYNLRAVRLHDLARQVVADYDGKLPADLKALLKLKGVGRYTAAAVACFAFEQPVAMVDTNVRRVLGRVFGVAPTAVERLADQVLPTAAAYAWNQALMDLGASLCRARAPRCLACPLVGVCHGPVPTPAAGKVQRAGSEPFVGSRRYYRGRLVEAVRSLARGSTVDLDDLVAMVAPPVDHVRVSGLVPALATDGLLGLHDDRVRLPE